MSAAYQLLRVNDLLCSVYTYFQSQTMLTPEEESLFSLIEQYLDENNIIPGNNNDDDDEIDTPEPETKVFNAMQGGID